MSPFFFEGFTRVNETNHADGAMPADASPPGGADAAGADRHDGRALGAGQFGGPVGARVRHHHQMNGNADLPGRLPDTGEAREQEVLFVVRGDHHPHRFDHTRPSACATDTGRPSPRT